MNDPTIPAAPRVSDASQHSVFGLPFIRPPRPLVVVIELAGVIDASRNRRSLNLAALEGPIEAAFKSRKVSAVVLAINSPGGSPVQSRLIHAAIRQAADKSRKPVFAFIEDVGASSGYMLAVAADEIYADASSIVGSIGVISAGFGLSEAITRIGVERRVHTAGGSKSQLDPFLPEKAEDVRRLREVLDAMHAEFIELVKNRRQHVLKDEPDLFSGAFWTGRRALELGLIDGIAHLAEFMRARFGKGVSVRKLRPRLRGAWRLLGAERAGLIPGRDVLNGLERGWRQAAVQAAPSAIDFDDLLAAIEERAIWNRFGL